MLKLHQFYRQFEDTPKEKRFAQVQARAETTSLFEIFQQLNQVRAQLRFFEGREEFLLSLAEETFKQNNGKPIQGPQ